MVDIGIIGAGKWGRNHLRTLSSLDCNLVGISDLDIKKKELARGYNIDFFHNYNDLIKKVDAVVIATPTDTHYRIAVDCLNNNKHVFIEKPIASKSKKSKELVDLSHSKNLILSVGYLYRFNNSIKRVKEIIKEIGEIQYINCRYIHSTKPPRKDSGVIINLGIHPLDILNFITGKRPIKVFAKKKNLISDKLEDSAIILLDYNDFFAFIEVCCTHPKKKRDMWIIAEKEKIYVDYFNQKIMRYPISINYDKVIKDEPFEEKVTVNEPLKDELDYFIKLVKNKKQEDIITEENIGKEEYFTIKTCELSNMSAEIGREIEIK